MERSRTEAGSRKQAGRRGSRMEMSYKERLDRTGQLEPGQKQLSGAVCGI